MRKKQKQELKTKIKGLRLTQCPEHKLPLVRHEVKVRGEVVGYCWDCPGKMSKQQQKSCLEADPDGTYNDDTPCFYHIHEGEY